MKFKMRMVKPKASPWFDVQGEDRDDAIYNFHAREVDGREYAGYRFRVEEKDKKVHYIYFALVEVEGDAEPLVSRIFSYGIWRSGRVATGPTIQEIAEKLGWTHPPQDLLGEWDGEETMEEAEVRKEG